MAPTLQLRDLDFRVLAALAAAPAYGYELLRWLKEEGAASAARPPAQSSLYHCLTRLSRLGLTTSRHVSQPKAPARCVYALTTRGRRLLQAELDSYLFEAEKATERHLAAFLGSRDFAHRLRQIRYTLSGI